MKFSKKEIIIKSWNQILPNLSLLILCVGFIFFINLVLGGIQDKVHENLSLQSIIFTISSYLFQMGLSLGLIRIYLNLYKNKEAGFSQIFGSFHLLLSYLLASIIILIVMLIFALPGIIFMLFFSSSESFSLIESFLDNMTIIPLVFILSPIIYFSVRLQFYSYFLVDKECGVLEAIEGSFLITKGLFLELFTLGALISLIVLISIIPFGLGLIFSIPLSTMVTTNLYNILIEKNRKK